MGHITSPEALKYCKKNAAHIVLFFLLFFRFSINIQSGASTYPPPDLALHFDARFFSYSIVRNSRVNGVWGPEENMISHFPFQPGMNFDMIIKVQSDAYMIILNGQQFISFRHRLNAFTRFNILQIENDVIVYSIRYS